MVFANVPIGPFDGRAEILRGYREQPPDDTMTVESVSPVDPDTDRVRFRWDSGGPGYDAHTLAGRRRGPARHRLRLTVPRSATRGTYPDTASLIPPRPDGGTVPRLDLRIPGRLGLRREHHLR
jgi:hypothetical protein